tara:strand:+ start:149 stop:1108 length:960 start_codon:yes stop_codon:yes gene_type:complete
MDASPRTDTPETGPSVLPNFLIAGAPKSGTSSVHRWLAEHPEAKGSIRKETYFMVDPGTHMFDAENHVSATGLAGYADNFEEGPDMPAILFESTPSYLYSDTALQTAARFPGPVKVFFVLREPGDQIYSLYRYFRSNWDWIPADMSFGDFLEHARAGTHPFKGNELAVNCLRFACYVDYLRKWRDVVGPGNIRVDLFERVQSDPRGMMQDLAAWLGIDPGFYDDYAFPSMNRTYKARNKMLQAINLRVRRAIPKSALRQKIRAAYHAVNSAPPDSAASEDEQLKRRISEEFAACNAALAAEFGLDVGGWPGGTPGAAGT